MSPVSCQERWELCHQLVIRLLDQVFMSLFTARLQILQGRVLSILSDDTFCIHDLRDSFAELEAAEAIEAAVEKTLAQGILTRDLGGQAGTAQMTEAIINNL